MTDQTKPVETTQPSIETTTSFLSSLLESAKTIGMPATIAAVISALITITPFVFKIDERYAKATELEESLIETRSQIQQVSAEVNKVAGAVEMLSDAVDRQNQMLIEIQNNLIDLARATSQRQAALVRPIENSPLSPAPQVTPRQIVVPQAVIDNNEIQEFEQSLENIKRSLSESRRTLDQIQEE